MPISQSRFPERTAPAEVAPVPHMPAAVPPGAPKAPPEGAPGNGGTKFRTGAAPGPAVAKLPASVAGPGSETPGAGAKAGSCSPVPGTTWVLELPPGLKTLSLNGRLHWSEQRRRAAAIRKAAWAMTLQQHVPPLGRVAIVVEYQPPDRRHRDADNTPAVMGKHAIDGLVAAGVIPDDEAGRYVASIAYRIGPVYPRGRLVLTITQMPPPGRIETCHD